MAVEMRHQNSNPFAEAMVAAASEEDDEPRPAAPAPARKRPSVLPGMEGKRSHPGEPRLSVAGRAMRIRTASCITDSCPLKPARAEGELAEAGEAQDENEEDNDEPCVNFREACITLIINCLGGGIVVFPKMMADGGIVPAPLLCILGCVVCLECGCIMSDACTAVEATRGCVIRSYEMLANELGGVPFKRALTVTKNFAMLGFIIVYMSFVVDSVSSLMSDASGEWAANKTNLRFFLVFPVFAGLGMLTDMSQLAKIADLASVAVAIVVIGAIVGSAWRATLVPKCDEGQTSLPVEKKPCRAFMVFPEQDFLGDMRIFGRSMAFFVFTFAMLGTVPTLRSQLEDRSQMPAVLRLSFSIILVCYLSVAAVGYYGFGEDAPSNVLSGLGGYPKFSLIANAGAAAMIVNILLGAPIFAICVIRVFEQSGTGAVFQPMSKPNIALRVALMFMLTLISYVVPYVVEMIGIVSSLFGVCNNIFFPLALFYLSLPMLKDVAGPTPMRKVFHGFIAIVGILVLVFGLWGSIDKLVSLLKKEKETGQQAE